VVAVRRSDVGLASLDPTVGVEIRKTRPVIVISNHSINHLSHLAVDRRRLVQRLGGLPPERMAQVERALKNTLT